MHNENITRMQFLVLVHYPSFVSCVGMYRTFCREVYLSFSRKYIVTYSTVLALVHSRFTVLEFGNVPMLFSDIGVGILTRMVNTYPLARV